MSNGQAYVFIENATTLTFVLKDIDQHIYAIILPSSLYSLKLNFSNTGNKVYFLIFEQSQISFVLDLNGEVPPPPKGGVLNVNGTDVVSLQISTENNEFIVNNQPFQDMSFLNLTVKKDNRIILTSSTHRAPIVTPVVYSSYRSEVFHQDFADRH